MNGARKQRWRMTYRHGLERCERERVVQASEAVRDVVCEVCSRKFRREGDKKRHKCVAERRKPVWEQRGAVQCGEYLTWFRSRGELAVHRYRPGT